MACDSSVTAPPPSARTDGQLDDTATTTLAEEKEAQELSAKREYGELKVLASEIDHACRVAGVKAGNLSSSVAYPPAEWSTHAVVEAQALASPRKGARQVTPSAASPSPSPRRATSGTTSHSPGLERQRMATAAASTRTTLALDRLHRAQAGYAVSRAQSPKRAEAYPPAAWAIPR